MTPAQVNITIRRGDTKTITFRVRERQWNPALNGGVGAYEPGPYRDLTGWAVFSQIRADVDSEEPAATFDATISDQVETPGGVTLKLAPAVTKTRRLGIGRNESSSDMAGESRRSARRTLCGRRTSAAALRCRRWLQAR